MTEKDLQQNQANPISSLTQREQEVLCRLARGERNGEIAAMINIEERTVRFHLGNLCKRLDIRGRGKLQAWAWKHGFGEK